MTTKKIIESDICATCVNVCLLEPTPPTGPWERKALCTAGWPYTRVFASANAIDECQQYERVMQPTRPWPFPPTSGVGGGYVQTFCTQDANASPGGGE